MYMQDFNGKMGFHMGRKRMDPLENLLSIINILNVHTP